MFLTSKEGGTCGESKLQVGASGFSECGLSRFVIRDIVHELKWDTQVPPIRYFSVHIALDAATEHHRAPRALGHQARHLHVRFLQVHPPRVRRCRCLLHLQDLAFDEVGYDARDELDYLGVAETCESGAGTPEDEVPA